MLFFHYSGSLHRSCSMPLSLYESLIWIIFSNKTCYLYLCLCCIPLFIVCILLTGLFSSILNKSFNYVNIHFLLTELHIYHLKLVISFHSHAFANFPISRKISHLSHNICSVIFAAMKTHTNIS